MKNYMGRSNKLRQRAVVAGFVCSLFLLVVCLVDNEYNLLTEDQKGYQLFQKDQFDMAAREFNSLAWKGVALFRNGQFEEAASAFSGMDSPEGCLNHGNSLVMLGKYEDAIERYERALALKPAWSPAEINLALARTRAKALEKKGGEMTGGKLAADEYVFSNNSSKEKGEEETVAGGEPSQAEQRAIWLRQIQTKPADFLRTKFAYQYQMAEASTAVSDGKGSEQTPEQE